MLKTLEQHSDIIRALLFLSNGMLLVSVLDDKTVRLWDRFTSATLQTLERHLYIVKVVVLSSDSNLVASASIDKTVRL